MGLSGNRGCGRSRGASLAALPGVLDAPTPQRPVQDLLCEQICWLVILRAHFRNKENMSENTEYDGVKELSAASGVLALAVGPWVCRRTVQDSLHHEGVYA